jgi:hypothetical protein
MSGTSADSEDECPARSEFVPDVQDESEILNPQNAAMRPRTMKMNRRR